jgi:pteridine reductase
MVDSAGTALVTGAARRLGREIALFLAERGYDLAVHYLGSKSEALEVKRLVEAKGRRCGLFRADLFDRQESVDLVALVKEQFADLNLVVNNASIFNRVSFMDTERDEFDRNFSVHVAAPFFIAQQFARHCGSGQIVNIIDTAVAGNSIDYFAYLLSKKTLLSLTTLAARALAPQVRVNGIAPGSTTQPIDDDESYMDRRALEIPLRMKGDPRYILAALAYLLDNPFVTGECLFVDGGAHLGS